MQLLYCFILGYAAEKPLKKIYLKLKYLSKSKDMVLKYDFAKSERHSYG